VTKLKDVANPCNPISMVSPFEGLEVILIDPLAAVPLLENTLPVPFKAASHFAKYKFDHPVDDSCSIFPSPVLIAI
jgi:hypothetical protein